MEISSNLNLEPSTEFVNIPIETEDSSAVGILTHNPNDDFPKLKKFLGSHRTFQVKLNGGSSFQISPVTTVGSPVLTSSSNGYECQARKISGEKTVFISNGAYTMSVVEQTRLPGQTRNAPKTHDIFVPERLGPIGWIEVDSGHVIGQNSRTYVEGTPFRFRMTRYKNAESPLTVTVSDETSNTVVGIGSATQWTRDNVTCYFLIMLKGPRTIKEFQFTIDDEFDLKTEAALFASFAALMHDRLEYTGRSMTELIAIFIVIALVVFAIGIHNCQT